MRLAELAEQSANGTYSTRQRLSLNAEYQSLLSEYGRIGSTTSFNGIKLLANSRTGNPAQLILQAGINGSSNSLLSVSTGDTTSFSGVVRLGSAWPDFVEAYNLSELNQYFGGQMGTATVTDNTGRERRVIFGLSRYEDDPTLASLSMWDLEAFASNPSAPQTQVGTAIITVTDGATGQISNVDNLALSFADGKTARISFDFSSLRVSKDRGEFTEVPDLGDTTVLDFTSVFDVTTSRNALTQVQSKLSTLSSLRGGFGAAQSRLQIALQLATQSGEASAAAESRIRDADIAQESSLLVRNQILQQIGAAVLAQANQAPALALSLLRG